MYVDLFYTYVGIICIFLISKSGLIGIITNIVYCILAYFYYESEPW